MCIAYLHKLLTISGICMQTFPNLNNIHLPVYKGKVNRPYFLVISRVLNYNVGKLQSLKE